MGIVDVKIGTKGYLRDIVREFSINSDEEKTFYIKKEHLLIYRYGAAMMLIIKDYIDK